MEVNKEEIPQVQNPFQFEEDKEETSLGKRKIDTIIKTEDEREVKRIAFFSQEPLEEEEEEEEDIDMIEEDTEREDHRDNSDKIMEDNVLEEESVVDFYGFF
jgi:hypothetical protein